MFLADLPAREGADVGALEAAYHEIAEGLADGVTEAEMERARALHTSTWLHHLATVDGRADMFSQMTTLFDNVTQADLQEQFALARQLRDKVSEANNAVIQIRSVKQQVADRLTKSSDAQLKAAGDRLTKNLSAVEEEIYQVRNQSGQDPLNFPIKVNNRLASLLGVVNRGDGKPIASAYPIFNDLKGELKVQTDRLQQVLATDLKSFNAEATRLGLETVSTKGPIAH